jgi:hypothetical protein
MPKKVTEAPVVEVAPSCDHTGTLYDAMRQEPGGKTMLMQHRCTKCDYKSDWKPEHEFLLRPMPAPIVTRF